MVLGRAAGAARARTSIPSDPASYFEFIYPPLPAVLLAIPRWFGKIPLYVCLSLLNVVAWWMTGASSPMR